MLALTAYVNNDCITHAQLEAHLTDFITAYIRKNRHVECRLERSGEFTLQFAEYIFRCIRVLGQLRPNLTPCL